MNTKKRFLVAALTFLLALSLLLPAVMQRPAADTQTGFILLSPGRDGQIGTGDDMYATEKGDTVKGAVDTTKYSLTSSVPSKVDVGKIILAADNTSVPADGKTVVTITATVVDKYNNPVPDGSVVSFTTSLGTLSQSSVKTANGAAVTTITSTTAGIATITASCNGVNGQITLIFTSLLPPPPPGMQGYSPPAGTVAIASGIYANYTPDKAIDGVLSLQSKWNSGGVRGWLQLNFPKPQTISGIQIAADAYPATQETYTIYGYQNGKWIQISSPTARYVYHITEQNVQQSILLPISVISGTYDAIKIDVYGGSSWVAIIEVTLIP